MITLKQGLLMTHSITFTALLAAMLSWQQSQPRMPEARSAPLPTTSLSAWP